MVGALIEYPSLLSDPEVQVELAVLEGPGALAVAALKDSLTEEITLDTSRFLAQIPPAIQAFARERLAAPHHEGEREAKSHLLENALKLKRLILSRETDEIAREVDKAAGDPEQESQLLREALGRARQKHNLK